MGDVEAVANLDYICIRTDPGALTDNAGKLAASTPHAVRGELWDPPREPLACGAAFVCYTASAGGLNTISVEFAEESRRVRRALAEAVGTAESTLVIKANGGGDLVLLNRVRLMLEHYAGSGAAIVYEPRVLEDAACGRILWARFGQSP